MLAVPQIHQLSQAAHDRLAAEHEQLITHGRTDIARKIQAARELGDLKENGDYHAAKEEQGKMEARIRQLTATIENAEIVDTTGSEIVMPGVVVEVRYEDDDDTMSFLIGSIEEQSDDLDVMSPGSPLGQLLMGRSAGDVVDFAPPAGGAPLTVAVVSITS